METDHVDIGFYDSFTGYSMRINLRRLQPVLLMVILYLMIQVCCLSFPYADREGLSRQSVILLVSNGFFLLSGCVLFTIVHRICGSMVMNNQFIVRTSHRALFAAAVFTIFFGLLSGATLAGKRSSFLASYVLVCFVVSTAFYIRFRRILIFHFIACYLNYVMIFFVYPERSESVFQVLLPIGLFFGSAAWAGLLQNERRITFHFQQEAVLLERRRKQSLFKKYCLSDREAEVTALLIEGASYREIAGILKISRPTVKSHAVHIYRKAGVARRAELIYLFNDNNTV